MFDEDICYCTVCVPARCGCQDETVYCTCQCPECDPQEETEE